MGQVDVQKSQAKTPNRPKTELAVAVFAHNEEAYIEACLARVALGLSGIDSQITVLANGCRDRTVMYAERFRAGAQLIRVVNLRLGDKCNAWNEYVHNYAPDSKIHIFIDGDTLPEPTSFAAATRALERNSYAQAVAGLPIGGRSARQWRNHVMARHGLPGPFYGLRGTFLESLRARGVRLPIGLIGDDVLVPLLVRTDLGCIAHLDRERVVPCPEAEFTYESFSYLNVAHMRLYIRRRLRNSVRHFQNRLLIPEFRKHGLSALPDRIEQLYTEEKLKHLYPRANPIDFAFDIWALARIRAARTGNLPSIHSDGPQSNAAR